MDGTHVLKIMYEDTPTGRRYVIRPKRKWRNNIHEDRSSLVDLYPVAVATAAAATDAVNNDNDKYHPFQIIFSFIYFKCQNMSNI